MAAPGEQDRYTFTLAAPSLLYFDSLTNNANLRWSLSGPSGTPVSNRTFTTSDGSGISGNPVLSLPAGAYTLTVSGVGATTGAYSFRLLDLSQATAADPRHARQRHLLPRQRHRRLPLQRRRRRLLLLRPPLRRSAATTGG